MGNPVVQFLDFAEAVPTILIPVIFYPDHTEYPSYIFLTPYQISQLYFFPNHTEHDTVALAHALGVVRPDVLLDDLFPATTAEPAAEEALNLWVILEDMKYT